MDAAPHSPERRTHLGVLNDACILRTRLRCASAAIVRANLARPYRNGRIDGSDSLSREDRAVAMPC